MKAVDLRPLLSRALQNINFKEDVNEGHMKETESVLSEGLTPKQLKHSMSILRNLLLRPTEAGYVSLGLSFWMDNSEKSN